MYLERVLLIGALTLVHSIKYIFFNIDNVFSTINFHNVQTASVSNYISLGKTNSNSFFDLSQYALFGFFPDTSNAKEGVTEAMIWVERNKFLVSIMILFLILVGSFVLKILIECFICKTKHNDSKECNGRKWLSYYNFIFRMLLISYFNITMISLNELTHISDNLALDFLAVVIFILLSLGFPVYIAIIMGEHIYALNNPKTKLKYGPFYLQFKPDGVNIRFIVVLICKQLVYAIVVNLKSTSDLIKNTILLVISVLFLLFMVCNNPYKKSVHQKSSVVMAGVMMLMICVNYFLILDNFSTSFKETFRTIAYLLQLSIVAIAIITSAVHYLKYSYEDKIVLHEDNINDGKYIDLDVLNSQEVSVSKSADSQDHSDDHVTALDIGQMIEII